MSSRFYSILISAGLLVLLSGMPACHKQEFLDKKPNTNLLVPSTLTDFQALLDNTFVMGLTPVLGEVSTDDYYLTNSTWQSLDPRELNAYVWAKDLYNGQGGVADWNIPYQQVFYANVILDGLTGMKVDTSNIDQWNNIKGSALFTRAYAFYNVAQLFAPPYDPATAGMGNNGIPIRLSSDINLPSIRSTVLQTYQQITGDLRTAVGLLPAAISYSYRNRPSRPAAQALLASVYLSKRQYDSAGLYADSALQLYDSLMDYNSLSTSSPYPFDLLNSETLYQSSYISNTNVLLSIVLSGVLVDTTLIRSYQPNDLRRVLFYRNKSNDTANLKGTYSGNLYPFSGLATDELYLIRAECAARAGQLTAAMNDLNGLLRTRWKTGTYTNYTIVSQAAAVDTILAERRKELAFRGQRWSDLRRLNLEGRNITLMRKPDTTGQTYLLSPNSPNYILPIPPDVIALGGISQNARQ